MQAQHQRGRGIYIEGDPYCCPVLMPAAAPCSGTKELWAAGCQSSVPPALCTKLLPPYYDSYVSGGRRALAGNDASLDPRQARAPPVLWRIESRWKRGPQWIPKKTHSARTWEAQVASVVGPPLLSLPFCFPSSPWAENLLRSAASSETPTPSKMAWPRPGPWCTRCSANSQHQQKDKSNSAIIRPKNWLQWMGKSKRSHCTLMEEVGVSWGSATDQYPDLE